MNAEDIYGGVTGIRDDLVDQAKKRPRRRWVPAIAAMLALAVLAGVTLRPGGGMTVKAIAEAEYPGMPPLPTEDDFHDPETGDWDATAFQQLYGSWSEAQFSRWKDLPEDYGGSLDGFFTSSIPRLLGDTEGKNRVCSPVNLCMALSILAELTDGSSRQQLLDLLGQDSLQDLRTLAGAMWRANYCDDGATTTILANSLWLNEDVSFVPSTMKTLARDYYASSYRGEMGSEDLDQALRDWINRQTGGLLEEQAAGLHMEPETVLALVSTIYYRAKWQSEFLQDNTAPQTFHAPSGDMSCDFLHRTGASGTYYWGDRFSAVSEPLENYGGEMWFFLPDEGVSPEELLEDPQFMELLLMDRQWENWAGHKYLLINLAVPKFDVSSDLDLTDALLSLGVTDVFDPAASDFSPMTKDVETVYLSQASHAVRVAIDEEGITAAAYTMLEAPGAGMPPEEEVDFVLDRPFLFAVTGIDGLPLFAGVVNQPA